ncbi:MAG TPA: RimK/LysX family protein [Candidatus Saccharimonadales bacterium]|nr:RimK/LysX family protein [Candidatus Saccharimonadales bacterium]
MFKDLHIIGAVAQLNFVGHNDHFVPARVDTGARTSAVWASNIKIVDDELTFNLFGKSSPYFDGCVISTKEFTSKKVRSTSGFVERRYVVKLPININGRRIKASFTLANREHQAYPVLVGRNVLRGKFAVDLKHVSQQITKGRIQ